jgi:hypothetical protein
MAATIHATRRSQRFVDIDGRMSDGFMGCDGLDEATNL